MIDENVSDAYDESSIQQLSSIVDPKSQKVIIILNKSDIYKKNNSDDGETEIKKAISEIKSICNKNSLATEGVIPVSAKEREGLEIIKETLIKSRNFEMSHSYSTLVTNIRHFEALKEAKISLERVKSGLTVSLPTDLLAQDIAEGGRRRRHGDGDQRIIQNNFLPIPGVGEPFSRKFLQLAGVSDIHKNTSPFQNFLYECYKRNSPK